MSTLSHIKGSDGSALNSYRQKPLSPRSFFVNILLMFMA
jgi:hypothetical protein